MDILRAHAVDLSLGLGDAAEDPERVLFHERREVTRVNQRADFAMRAAVHMFMIMLVGMRMSVVLADLMPVPVLVGILVFMLMFVAMRVPAVRMLVRMLQRRVLPAVFVRVMMLRVMIVLVMMMHMIFFAVLVRAFMPV